MNPIKSPPPPTAKAVSQAAHADAAEATSDVQTQEIRPSARNGAKVAIGLVAVVAAIAGWWGLAAPDRQPPMQADAAAFNQAPAVNAQPLPTLVPLSTVAPLTAKGNTQVPAVPAAQAPVATVAPAAPAAPMPQVQVQPQTAQQPAGRTRPFARSRSSR